MTDPERLSKGSAHSLAALLLQAGAREKPAAAVLSRTTRAVAVTATAAAAAALVKSAGSASAATVGASGSTAPTLGVVTVTKWVAIGALGGAVAMSSLQALDEHAPQRATLAASANATVSKRDTHPMRAAPRVAEPIVSAAPSAPEPVSVAEVPKPHSAEPALGELTKPAVPERAESALLAAEVRFVDRGRGAFQRSAFAEVLAQLAPYERLFPRQQLLTEVLFLRMESCSRLGNGERAKTLAAQLLTLGVVGRQAAQARAVLGP